MNADLFSAMARAVVDGDAAAAAELAQNALAGHIPPAEALDKGFVPGIRTVGGLWEDGEYFLPELIASAEAMKAAAAVLRPALEAAGSTSDAPGTVVIGTIEGDIHDIGKNLVSAMLTANGFKVIDLGADVKLTVFLETAESAGADLICLSALLTTTMLGQRRFIELLVERGLRSRFKVLVGGAPTSRKWAEEIGADGYGESAPAAVREALALLGKVSS
ncbi:MAG: corrinoid protein [Candidatus Aminicenantes bacterium]|nr:corrinoid protein [Candidatus Aminicenantes bacterium]